MVLDQLLADLRDETRQAALKKFERHNHQQEERALLRLMEAISNFAQLQNEEPTLPMAEHVALQKALLKVIDYYKQWTIAIGECPDTRVLRGLYRLLGKQPQPTAH